MFYLQLSNMQYLPEWETEMECTVVSSQINPKMAKKDTMLNPIRHFQ